MSNVLYPNAVRGLTWPVSKGAEYSTEVLESPSWQSSRVAHGVNPVWHYELTYEYLKDNPADLVAALGGVQTDYRFLQGFYLARNGRYDNFLFNDVYDNTVVAGPLQLLQDAAGNYYSPLQRSIAGQTVEDITDLASALQLFENGVPSVTGFTLNFGGLTVPGHSTQGLYVAWASAPTAPITATFQFYNRVRFEMDQQGFDQFMQYLWTGGGSSAKKSDVMKLVTSPILNSDALASMRAGRVPSPPITAPLFSGVPGNMLVLYPSTVSFTTGFTDSGHLVPCIAYGDLSSGTLLVPNAGTGFVSPTATFGGYALPSWLPAANVKAVFIYVVGLGINQQLAGAPTASGATTFTGGSDSYGGQNFYTSQLDGISVPANTFPFASLQTVFSLSVTPPASYVRPAGFAGVPCLVVYY